MRRWVRRDVFDPRPTRLLFGQSEEGRRSEGGEFCELPCLVGAGRSAVEGEDPITQTLRSQPLVPRHLEN